MLNKYWLYVRSPFQPPKFHENEVAYEGCASLKKGTDPFLPTLDMSMEDNLPEVHTRAQKRGD